MIAVLGHYPDYVTMARANGWTHFQVSMAEWSQWTDAERWEANRAFLDQAAAAGMRFLLATSPAQARAGSWYERELRHLAALGYTPHFNGSHWELVR